MTALAIACHLKDPTLIELLVDAGADCKVLDQEGNTAILFAAISPTDDKIPNQELAPAIFKVIISTVLLFVKGIELMYLFSRFTKV